MSVLVIPNVAKTFHLSLQLGASTDYPVTLKLFNNDAPINASTTLAMLNTATFSGYSHGTLSGRSVAGSLDAFSRAYATWNPLTWTKSGATGNTIYGYWVINAAGDLLWCEKFDTAVPMSSDGAYLVITPRLTFTSQY